MSHWRGGGRHRQPVHCGLRKTTVIRKVGTNGIITTVAGNGWYKATPATEARRPMRNWMYPTGVAVDATGNLFIADTYNNRIRKVGTNGIITTVAGTWTATVIPATEARRPMRN